MIVIKTSSRSCLSGAHDASNYNFGKEHNRDLFHPKQLSEQHYSECLFYCTYTMCCHSDYHCHSEAKK